MGPILEPADYLEWAADHLECVPPSGIPEIFPAGTLDPAAELSVADVRLIGRATREVVKDTYTQSEARGPRFGPLYTS